MVAGTTVRSSQSHAVPSNDAWISSSATTFEWPTIHPAKTAINIPPAGRKQLDTAWSTASSSGPVVPQIRQENSVLALRGVRLTRRRRSAHS